MVSSLRRTITSEITTVDAFLTEATETLGARPQTVEEIGTANAKHSEFGKRKNDILPLFDSVEQKNKLLRTVAGGGVEQMGNLHSRWDKFEIMMESHQLMVKEQVDVMKSNVESRVKNFQEQLSKFAARWHQLKPGDDVMEGERKAAMAAVQSIKERKQEFDELEKSRQALMYKQCYCQFSKSIKAQTEQFYFLVRSASILNCLLPTSTKQRV